MRRAPQTSRVLLALGALTLAALAGSLLTSSGTAAAHEADDPPHPRNPGAEEGDCPLKTELEEHEDCVDGAPKPQWYHHNYWYPSVCFDAARTDCTVDYTAALVKGDEAAWPLWALPYTMPQSLIRTAGNTLTQDLAAIPPNRWDPSWCGPYDTKRAAANADCGHSNRPHLFFDHRALEGDPIATHTVFVKEHDHCDDGTHPSDHDNDTCPEDVEVCPRPAAPVVTAPGEYRNGRSEQKVEWTVTNPDRPCHIRGYDIQYGNETARPINTPGVKHSWERQPGQGSRIRVYVRARNTADGEDQCGE